MWIESVCINAYVWNKEIFTLQVARAYVNVQLWMLLFYLFYFIYFFFLHFICRTSKELRSYLSFSFQFNPQFLSYHVHLTHSIALIRPESESKQEIKKWAREQNLKEKIILFITCYCCMHVKCMHWYAIAPHLLNRVALNWHYHCASVIVKSSTIRHNIIICISFQTIQLLVLLCAAAAVAATLSWRDAGFTATAPTNVKSTF